MALSDYWEAAKLAAGEREDAAADARNDKLFVSVGRTRDGQYVAGVAYPDSVVALASAEPRPTRDEALKHGETLLAVVQEQEARHGRTRQDVNDNGIIVSWVERNVRPSARDEAKKDVREAQTQDLWQQRIEAGRQIETAQSAQRQEEKSQHKPRQQ